jgi:hypothetical protein
MKLSKERLRQLIKEELNYLIKEYDVSSLHSRDAGPDGEEIKLSGALLAADRDFVSKVNNVALQISANPDHLMNIMKFESGLDPAIVNSASGATGLIQFMPATARSLGTTTAQLGDMSGLDQMDFVSDYFSGSGPYDSATDLYLKVFYPYAINQEGDYIIGSEVSLARAQQIAEQNPYFDKNEDGLVSKQSIVDKMEAVINRAAARV